MSIEYRLYNRKSLLDYTQSKAYADAKHVAISKHRASSQYHNPRCQDEDIIMIMAWDGSHLAGYLGVLPDDLFASDGKRIHVGWLSCLWVNPNLRGHGIGMQMLNQILAEWKQKIILTEFTPEAGRLYEKSGMFRYLPLLQGYRFYFRSCLRRILPPKSAFLKRCTPVFCLIDSCLNACLDLRLKGRRSRALMENSNILSEDPITIHSAFRRTNIELDWTGKHPWLIPVDDGNHYRERYFFSAVEKDFIQVIHTDADHHNSLFLGTIRDGHFKLAYLQYFDITFAADVIDHYVSDGTIDYVTIFDLSIHAGMKHAQNRPLLCKKIERKWMTTSALYDYLTDGAHANIAPGDGDSIFT